MLFDAMLLGGAEFLGLYASMQWVAWKWSDFRSRLYVEAERTKDFNRLAPGINTSIAPCKYSDR